MSRKILVIDDDQDLGGLLVRFLGSKGYKTEHSLTGKKGLEMLIKKSYDLVITDFRLPDIDGLELIKEIKKTPKSPITIVITGYSDVRLAIKTIKLGAYDYLTKPLQPDELSLLIEEAIERQQDKEEEISSSSAPNKKAPARKKSPKAFAPHIISGKSLRSQKLKRDIELIAPTNMSVIILGETGTGKEVAARNIHALSDRSERPFVALDCGALTAELAASELFGHKKGSFTGALADKKGSFELANGGTIFLDEIGNLSYANQVKLLRVIQERQVKPIGQDKPIDLDVRIIVATNEDLNNPSEEIKFREDLYHRLNEFQIFVPPLRERSEDLMEYAHTFLKEANTQLNKEVEGFESNVEERLKQYVWHGNIRELKNVIKRATLMTEGKKVNMHSIPPEIAYASEKVVFDTRLGGTTDLKKVAEAAEKGVIIQVLQQTKNNKTKAAELLNVDRKTLYNKLTAYGIDA